MSMDNKERFSGRSADYTKGRPNYSEDLIQMLSKDLHFGKGSCIADIGSGTGKLSRQLLDLGCTVCCVEPNDDMRRIAEKELGQYEHFVFVKGSSENTRLQPASVDHITAAQAFHWFDAERFKAECRRILKPGGNVILIWNTRDPRSPFNLESYEIYKKYCPDFKGYHGGMRDDDRRIYEFYGGDCKKIIFDNPIAFTSDKFIARSLSASYSIKSDNENYDSYINALQALFEKFSANGIVMMQNHTTAYVGKIEK